jgi:hypothetical protein
MKISVAQPTKIICNLQPRKKQGTPSADVDFGKNSGYKNSSPTEVKRTFASAHLHLSFGTFLY